MWNKICTSGVTRLYLTQIGEVGLYIYRMIWNFEIFLEKSVTILTQNRQMLKKFKSNKAIFSKQ